MSEDIDRKSLGDNGKERWIMNAFWWRGEKLTLVCVGLVTIGDQGVEGVLDGFQGPCTLIGCSWGRVFEIFLFLHIMDQRRRTYDRRKRELERFSEMGAPETLVMMARRARWI